jgi:ubiquinone/menaquinone biosynthesis C-methylase UbiE
MYQQVIAQLREAYNRGAIERESRKKEDWKVVERQYFLELLQKEGKRSLLEIGAGTGLDSKFFQEQGLEVICTDLSPEMVKYCREKELTAYVMDFLHLDFPANSFAAIYSLNCLLHVPSQDLPTVLSKMRELLQPGGLFYLGVYGGEEREGIADFDQHEPKRFFSYHTDAYMQQVTQQFFELVYFKVVEVARDGNFHFQSIILRKPY